MADMSLMPIVVLASGSGTLLKALIDAQDKGSFTIVRVITDRECPAVQKARDAHIDTHVIPLFDNREQWNVELCEKISDVAPELVVSAGFMRVLGNPTVAEFEGKIINVHPALLPLFPGAHAVRDALDARAQKTGTTVHFVDLGVDSGPIIASHEVDIAVNDTEDSLHERIKVEERRLLVHVVQQFAQGRIKYEASAHGIRGGLHD